MLISLFKDVAPPVLLASAIVYGGTHYLIIAPKIGERVVAADHLPICRSDLAELAKKSGAEKLASIPLPTVDPMREYAIRQAEQIYNSPFMVWAQGASQGLADAIGFDGRGGANALRDTYEANKRAAGRAYRLAQEQARAWTRQQIDAADDICACLGEKAIDANRTEWAIYTGTLTFYTPAPIEAFDGQMANVMRSGACENGRGKS